MKSHLSGRPGEYIWDEENKRFTGRFRSKELVEDRRFTAQAEFSFMNGVCRGLSIPNPQEVARVLTEPEFNGYVVQGYSLIIDGVILSPEMWLSDAARLTGCAGIDSILTALGPLSESERMAKLNALALVFGKEIDLRGLDKDPEVVAARKKQQEHEEAQRRKARETVTVHEALSVRGRALVLKEWTRLTGDTELPWYLEKSDMSNLGFPDTTRDSALSHIKHVCNERAFNDWEGYYYTKERRYWPSHWTPSKWMWNNRHETYWAQHLGLINEDIVEQLSLQMVAELAVSKYRSLRKNHYITKDYEEFNSQQLLEYTVGSMYGPPTDYETKYYDAGRHQKTFFKKLRPDIPEDLRPYYLSAVKQQWKKWVGQEPVHTYFTSTQEFLDILHMETVDSPMRKQTKFSKLHGCDC